MESRSPLRVAVTAAALIVALPLVFMAAARAEDPAPPAKKRAPAQYTLESRVDVLEERGNYPCTDCHDNETQKANAIERELEEEHDELAFPHGGGRFWCLNCHSKNERDSLVDIKGRLVSFDLSHEVCLQCHSERAQDFARGGHGKRQGTWMGERMLTACVECHDPHSPSIKARKPVAMPQLRKGLPVPAAHATTEKAKPWDAVKAARGWTEKAAAPEGEGKE